MLKNDCRINSAFQSLKESIRLGIYNTDLLLDIGEAFAELDQNSTAKKALEYALVQRAKHQGQKQQRKVQEYLLQVGKVMTEYEK